MEKIRAILGGPAYRMECDVRHAAAMVDLTAALVNSGRCESISVDYSHGSPIEIPRNHLFGEALKSTATHLFWADSDVYWWQSQGLVEAANWLSNSAMPIVIVPVRQRDGRWNIILEGGDTTDQWTRLKTDQPTLITIPRSDWRPVSCYAGGMGLAVFNLPWYRVSWPNPPWFRTDYDPKGRVISEDLWHTRALHQVCAAVEEPICHYAHAVPVGHAARGTV